MNPQLLAAVVKVFWDGYRSSGTKSKRKSSKSGLFTMLLTAAVTLGYMKSDKLAELLPGFEQKVEAKLEDKLGPVGEQLGKAIEAKLGIDPNTFSIGGDGPIRVYFTKPVGNPADTTDIAHSCAGYIDGAKQTLDVAGFEINNKLIVKSLLAAKQRGVVVRVVTDTDYVDETGDLSAAGIPVVQDHRSALMHNKFIVIDGAAVWMGSMNFTENCAYRNNNNGVYLAVPQLAANYATKFRWMHEQKLFGKKPKDEEIPNPKISLPDGTVLENYFAPHDKCADHLTRLVQETQKSLDFLAFSFTHHGIGRAVMDKAQFNGVKVRGVFEKTQTASGHSEYGAMHSLGLDVWLDGNPRNMHHKVMVIDGATTVTGSFNFSESADKSNDENILFIRNNPTVAGLFTAEADRVLEVAKKAAGQ